MDLLVRLYALKPKPKLTARLARKGIAIRRVLAPELAPVTLWIGESFGAGWAGEATISFARQPPSCFIAISRNRPLGFACYDATARGFFGPTGVDEAARGQGIGEALLLACLFDMLAQGYAYAVIGDVGPVAFYARTVGATRIAGSSPGIVAGRLRATD